MHMDTNNIIPPHSGINNKWLVDFMYAKAYKLGEKKYFPIQAKQAIMQWRNTRAFAVRCYIEHSIQTEFTNSLGITAHTCPFCVFHKILEFSGVDSCECCKWGNVNGICTSNSWYSELRIKAIEKRKMPTNNWYRKVCNILNIYYSKPLPKKSLGPDVKELIKHLR